MSPVSWSSDSPASCAGDPNNNSVPGPMQSLPSQTYDVLARRMIRHLAQLYTPEQVASLMEEEGMGSQSDQSSVKSASVYAPSIMSDVNSVMSDDLASVFDSASVRSFSDTSSITGSIISNNSSSKTPQIPSTISRYSPAATAAAVPPTQSRSATWPASPSSPIKPDPDYHHHHHHHYYTAASSSAATPSATNNNKSATSSTSTPLVPTPTPTASKQKGTFICGFCAEENIPKTCTRKNDLKRHIEDFHNADAQWFCRHRGCTMVFDWQAAYKTHLKATHGGSRMALDEAKVNLCPQVVFACGFTGCTAIFEAAAEGDPATATFKEYVAHVVKHFDDFGSSGSSSSSSGNNTNNNNTNNNNTNNNNNNNNSGGGCGEWNYSTRLRNLLRQVGVDRVWAESIGAAAGDSLRWNPQTSVVLRKRLETRHLSDVRVLVRYAYLLASPSGSAPPDGLVPIPRDDFITPIRDDCVAVIPGHKTRADVQLPQPHNYQQQQQYDAGVGGGVVDSMEFRISRNSNPGLAAYLASQRSIRAPSRVQAGGARGAASMRIARPSSSVPHNYPSSASPTLNQQQPSSAQFFSSPLTPDPAGGASTMFDPRAGGLYGDSGGGSGSTGGNLNLMSHGRMVDPMTVSTNSGFGPSPSDVDMSDPRSIMDGFGTSYSASPGLQSPVSAGTPDSCLSSHPSAAGHPFYDIGRSHAY